MGSFKGSVSGPNSGKPAKHPLEVSQAQTGKRRSMLRAEGFWVLGHARSFTILCLTQARSFLSRLGSLGFIGFKAIWFGI